MDGFMLILDLLRTMAKLLGSKLIKMKFHLMNW